MMDDVHNQRETSRSDPSSVNHHSAKREREEDNDEHMEIVSNERDESLRDQSPPTSHVDNNSEALDPPLNVESLDVGDVSIEDELRMDFKIPELDHDGSFVGSIE